MNIIFLLLPIPAFYMRNLPWVSHAISVNHVQSILSIDPVVWFSKVLSHLRSLVYRIYQFCRPKHLWPLQPILFHQVLVQVRSLHYYLRLLNFWHSHWVQWRSWTVLRLNCCRIVQVLNHFLPHRFLILWIEFQRFYHFTPKVLLLTLFLTNLLEWIKFILRTLNW